MKKTIPLLLLGILLLTFTSAHQEWNKKETTYKETIEITTHNKGKTYKHTTNAHYHNNKRHTTTLYKEGWTWRTTKEYWNEAHKKQYHTTYKEKNWNKKNYHHKKHYHNHHNHDYHNKHYEHHHGNKDTYYTYTDYLNQVEEKTCYHNPPKGKLFYIKCP